MLGRLGPIKNLPTAGNGQQEGHSIGRLHPPPPWRDGPRSEQARIPPRGPWVQLAKRRDAAVPQQGGSTGPHASGAAFFGVALSYPTGHRHSLEIKNFRCRNAIPPGHPNNGAIWMASRGAAPHRITLDHSSFDALSRSTGIALSMACSSAFFSASCLANRSDFSRAVFSRTASDSASCSAVILARCRSCLLKTASARSWASFE
jgi:hypothetical protein